MSVVHSTLTGSDCHEPKGADTATANQVYVADGAGSGSFSKITSSSLDTTGATSGQVFKADGAGAGTFQNLDIDPTDIALATGVGTNENKALISDGTTNSWGYVDRLETGWRDLQSPFTAGKTATSPPTFAVWLGGVYANSFTVGDQLFLTFHLDHDYKIGSAFYPHIHWAPAGAMADTETVTWTIEWTAARGHRGEVFAAPSTIATTALTYTSSGVTAANTHIITEVADPGITVPNAEPDMLIVARVARGAGTHAGAIWGLALDAHYQVDRYATPSRSPDFYTP